MTPVTPFAAQADRSESLILRDALATSMLLTPMPSQNRLRPAEDPPDSTTGVGKSVLSPKASATIDAYGRTVDEPAIWMLSLAAAVVAPSAATTAQNAVSLVGFMDFSSMALRCMRRNPASFRTAYTAHVSDALPFYDSFVKFRGVIALGVPANMRSRRNCPLKRRTEPWDRLGW